MVRCWKYSYDTRVSCDVNLTSSQVCGKSMCVPDVPYAGLNVFFCKLPCLLHVDAEVSGPVKSEEGAYWVSNCKEVVRSS